MCNQDGPCGNGERLEAASDKVASAVAYSLEGDMHAALAAINDALGGDPVDGLMTCLAMGSIASKYFSAALGVPPGEAGYYLDPIANPLTGETPDIDQCPPGPVFAIRFMIAYSNSEYDMCSALYSALLKNEDPAAFASGVHEMFTATVGFARELLERQDASPSS